MKNEQIRQAWDSVNPSAETQQRMLGQVLTKAQSTTRTSRTTARWPLWKALIPVGAAVVLAAAVGISLFQNPPFPLDASHGVEVFYVDDEPGSFSAELVPMTEEELLTGVDIFTGTVTKIEYIKILFSDWEAYDTILTVRTSEILRGSLSPDDETRILVSPAVGQICSICQTTEKLSVGSRVLLLGTPSTSGFASSVDGTEVFYYCDAAPYYLSDPIRPIFLETDSGVQISDLWPTLSSQSYTSLDEVVPIIYSMIT